MSLRRKPRLLKIEMKKILELGSPNDYAHNFPPL